MKKIIAGLSLLLMMIAATAQDKNSAYQLIESQNYIFKAQSVFPDRGQLSQLTADYDLAVSKGSVNAWLPFFGRAYSSSYNTTDGGIKFNSTDFEHTVKKGKKNRWEITIKPKDAPDVQYLYLTVFENKRATLQVISTNRESISFNGYIIEGSPAKKKAF
ncbi:MAG TPA: DUF4251 domain-containing protein [Chitinophagaceae bacterium]